LEFPLLSSLFEPELLVLPEETDLIALVDLDSPPEDLTAGLVETVLLVPCDTAG